MVYKRSNRLEYHYTISSSHQIELCIFFLLHLSNYDPFTINFSKRLYYIQVMFLLLQVTIYKFIYSLFTLSVTLVHKLRFLNWGDGSRTFSTGPRRTCTLTKDMSRLEDRNFRSGSTHPWRIHVFSLPGPCWQYTATIPRLENLDAWTSASDRVNSGKSVNSVIL